MVLAEQAEGDRLIEREWRGHTQHSVYQLADGRLLKRYWVRPGVHHFARPWHCEHTALARLDDDRFGETYGYTERPHGNGWEAALTRTVVDGRRHVQLDGSDAVALGELLATLHLSGVLVRRTRGSALLRRPDGALSLFELPHARVARRSSLEFNVRCGRDVARLAQALLRSADHNRACREVARAYRGHRPLPGVAGLVFRCAAAIR